MSRARLVLYYFIMVSRRNYVESLRALWFFLRKEERTSMLSDKKINAQRGRCNGNDFDRSQPGDLILESLKEDGQATA